MKKSVGKIVTLILLLLTSYAIVDVLVTNHSTKQVNREIREINQRSQELIYEQEEINRQLREHYKSLGGGEKNVKSN